MHLDKARIQQLLKYGVTGVFGSVLYFAVLLTLVEVCAVRPLVASALSFVCTVVTSYFINCFWTFNSTSASSRQFVKYSMVSVFGLLLTTLITYVGVDLMQAWYVYSQVVVVVVVPISNYLLNSKWVFSSAA